MCCACVLVVGWKCWSTELGVILHLAVLPGARHLCAPQTEDSKLGIGQSLPPLGVSALKGVVLRPLQKRRDMERRARE